MGITDKTRKILWGRSGNRCAFCRQELVVNSTDKDDAAVVGDECHIVSPRNLGPRHRPDLPPDSLDLAENLILLCRTHHKMVDDQMETYTIEVLGTLKTNHERWVSAALNSGPQKLDPVRVVRVKGQTPSHLKRINTGQELLDVLSDSSAFSFQHDDPRSKDEMEVIKGFLQEAQDWGEISSDFESGQRVEASYRMTEMIRELGAAGFWVFGGREIRRLEGGQGGPSNFPIALLHVIRQGNPSVVESSSH